MLENGLHPPICSSEAYGWKNILVEEFCQPPGQEKYHLPTEHTLCLSLNRRPSRLSQVIGDRRLYVESLTNLLAVHLLRDYCVSQPRVAVHNGGLSDRQLLRVTDYINDRLAQDIKLSDLAQLLGMSQFHFGRLFKQSMGVTPHRYVLQQRIERAKQLLKETELSVMEIALLCGFSSHSHLGKWFRQHIGMAPKAYRVRVCMKSIKSDFDVTTTKESCLCTSPVWEK